MDEEFREVLKVVFVEGKGGGVKGMVRMMGMIEKGVGLGVVGRGMSS